MRIEKQNSARGLKRSKQIAGWIACAVAIGGGIAFAPSAHAQGVQATYDRTLKLLTLDATNADVGRVLDTIFQQAGGRYRFDNDVTGRVTLHVKNVAPDAVMKSALDQVGATYQIKDGIYRIQSTRVANPTSNTGSAPALPAGGQDANAPRQSLQLTASTITEAARKIEETFGKKLHVEGALPGRVSLDLRNVTFDQAVSELIRANAQTLPMVARTVDGVVTLIAVENLPNTTNSRDIPAAFQQRVGLNEHDTPLFTILQILSKQTGVAIKTTREVPDDIRVSVVAGNEPLWNVLQKVAIASRLRVEATGNREATLSPLAGAVATRRGNRIGGARDEYITSCPHCRYDFHSDTKHEWRFCPNCGERLKR